MLVQLAKVDLPFWLPVLGVGMGALALWGALRVAARRRLVDSLPTSKTTGVFIGLVEVQGTAETRRPVVSYLADTPCVYYSWHVVESWARTVTKSYTDSRGKQHTRTEQETGWRVVASGGEGPPFYLKDDCGLLQVNPAKAELEVPTFVDVFCDPSHPMYFGKGPATETPDSAHRRHFVEKGIPLHTPVYVMGRARERADIVAAEIAHDPEAPLFLISTLDEKQISRRYGRWFWELMGAGLMVCTLGVGIGVSLDHSADRVGSPFVLAAGGFIVVAGPLWLRAVYNSLVELRNRVASAWSQIDVQLKRRFDLIPRLEAAVAGLVAHERTVEQGMAELRAQSLGEGGPALGGRVIALAERYPQLKTDAAFRKLQRELSDTEQRIALARGYYNEIATYYNTKLQTFPEGLVAVLGRMKPRALFRADDIERAPVPVSLEK